MGAAGAPQGPEYRVEEMTFELEEERIPVYRPPADDADGEEGPDQDPGAPGSSGDGHLMRVGLSFNAHFVSSTLLLPPTCEGARRQASSV